VGEGRTAAKSERHVFARQEGGGERAFLLCGSNESRTPFPIKKKGKGGEIFPVLAEVKKATKGAGLRRKEEIFLFPGRGGGGTTRGKKGNHRHGAVDRMRERKKKGRGARTWEPTGCAPGATPRRRPFLSCATGEEPFPRSDDSSVERKRKGSSLTPSQMKGKGHRLFFKSGGGRGEVRKKRGRHQRSCRLAGRDGDLLLVRGERRPSTN